MEDSNVVGQWKYKLESFWIIFLDKLLPADIHIFIISLNLPIKNALSETVDETVNRTFIINISELENFWKIISTLLTFAHENTVTKLDFD